MAPAIGQDMKSYIGLYPKVCSIENLELAFKKARKGKTQKPYVIAFEQNLKDNLAALRAELLFHSYRPLPLKEFVIRDPKTRKISVSDFRDRIVHHAICNIIEPIYDKTFIYDSYANRKGKGTMMAVYRLDNFIRKVSKNGTAVLKSNNRCVRGFCLKGDIRHYFENISHKRLIDMLKRTIEDEDLIFLINSILVNHNHLKGMPLGNLTSQFFANVYLNEMDQFVKHSLKAKYYIRYVDDFVILHNNRRVLESYLERINTFLVNSLHLELNHDKSSIKPLSRGIEFLGFRIFYHHKLLRERNIRSAYKRINDFKVQYQLTETNYDAVYNFVQGWLAYAKNANTYAVRTSLSEFATQLFPNEVSSIEVNRLLKSSKL
ncbi:MAG: reverse transcriptase/maturase family protein [Candidatus Woesearchaeota archaeon]